MLVVELSAGQMIEDVRLAVDGQAPVFFHGRTGGMIPMPGEVLRAIIRAWAMTQPRAAAGDPSRTASTPDDRAAQSNDAAADEPDPLSLIELATWVEVEGPLPDGTAGPSVPIGALGTGGPG